MLKLRLITSAFEFNLQSDVPSAHCWLSFSLFIQSVSTPQLLQLLLSYRLRQGLEDSRLRLERDASLLPADSISVRLANRAHSSSTLLSIRSVACLILPSTDLKVSSSAGVSPNVGSISVSCLNLSSIVSEELSSVCVPVSVSSLITWGKIRGYWKYWNLVYAEI